MNRKKWYAIYTVPRWEKKVLGLLDENGYEVYCPMQKIQRQWKDRKKWVEEPLLKGYIFVCVSDADKWDLLKTSVGIINYVYWLGKPAEVREEDILRIRLFLNEYQHVNIEKVDFQKEDQVFITSGLFMDQLAIIEDIKGKYAVLKIPTLGICLKATLSTSLLQVSNKKK